MNLHMNVYHSQAQPLTICEWAAPDGVFSFWFDKEGCTWTFSYRYPLVGLHFEDKGVLTAKEIVQLRDLLDEALEHCKE